MRLSFPNLLSERCDLARYLTAADVAEQLHVSRSRAYEIVTPAADRSDRARTAYYEAYAAAAHERAAELLREMP